MKKLLYFFLSAVLLLNASCEDDNIFKQVLDPPAKVLPPATQTGANTFGCKVNGKVWLPSETAWVEFINGGLKVKGDDIYDPRETIIITIENYTISDIGTYVIGNSTNYLSKGVFWRGENRFQTDDIYKGSITITRIDTTKLSYIISGTFNFFGWLVMTPTMDRIHLHFSQKMLLLCIS